MKRNQLSIGLLSLFLIALLCNSFSINVKGASTLNFTFEKDVLYNNSGIQPLNETFNLKNQTVYSGHYPATYSFENEVGLMGDNISYIYNEVSDDSTYSATVIALEDGHKEIIEFLSAGDNGKYTQWYCDTDSQTTDGTTIEYWMKYIDNGVGKIRTYFYGISANLMTYIYFDSGTNLFSWWYGNGAGGSTSDNIASVADTWYHIKVEFDFTNNDFNLWLNGIKLGTDLPYRSDLTDTGLLHYRFMMNDAGGVNSMKAFVDAAGHSWDGYNGTYSFDSYIGEKGTDIEWVDFCDYTARTIVLNNISNHYAVLGLYDDDNMDDIVVYNDFDETISNGTIEFWFRSNNTQYYSSFSLMELDDVKEYFRVLNNEFWYYYDGTWDNVYTILDDVWYSIKFNWEADYSFNLFINGEQLISSEKNGYSNFTVGINRMKFYTGITNAVDYWSYIDGIGYSWDSYYNIGDNLEYYSIGDNMIPVLETNGSLEVDKYEFALEGINDFYDTGDQNPSTWDTTSTGTGVSQIGAGEEPTKDKIVYMFGTGVGNNFGIQKTNFDYTEKFIDINFGLMFIDWSGSLSFTMIEIHSSDATSIIGLAFYNDGRFAYIDDGVQILRTDIVKEVNYDIGLHINYDFDMCWIYYTVEGVLNETYVIDLLATGKTGLKEIDIDSILSGSEFTIVGLDYVGVYANGLSNAGKGEYGYLSIDLESPTVNWNFEHNNLFSIIASGKFAIYSNEGTYSIEDSIALIFSETEYYNSETLFNIYDQGYTDIDNPFLVIYLSDNIFNNVSYLNIEGIKFSEGSNVYYPTYTHAGINVNQSYFYVDSNNRLQFNLIANDGNLEYIQAVFDIQDIATENRSIRFYSNINGNSKAYFALDYRSERSSVIEFPYSARITNAILSQTEIIQNFTILITDNDLEINDICTGYIKEIKLVYYTDLTTTITTLNLLAIIIPLIVLVAPPTVLRERFGNKVVLPMFILMALICVISQLIPIWLFFVIALGSLAFMVLKDKVEVKI